MVIQQNGAAVVVRTFNFQILVSAGTGTLNGHNLHVSYTNNLMVPGMFDAVVSPDARQMNLTDYGKGFPQSFVFNRYQ